MLLKLELHWPLEILCKRTLGEFGGFGQTEWVILKTLNNFEENVVHFCDIYETKMIILMVTEQIIVNT